MFRPGSVLGTGLVLFLDVARVRAMLRAGACVVLLVLVDSSLSLVNNSMIEMRNALEELKENKLRKATGAPARRAYETTKKEGKSTSSDSRDKSGGSGSADETLGLSFSESSEEKAKKKINKRLPKSTEERHGWRKWHRKCTPCREDMRMKWRDPRIKWICGAFQRARRSFKSLCMMHYRNCQDGTMFVKIHEHRCQDNSTIHPIGEHFFYDYKVRLEMDSGSHSSSSSGEARKSSD